MNDDCGDLDPYLVDLFAPEQRFRQSDAGGDHAAMSIEAPITMEQLAEAAGAFFRGSSLHDVPAKLWIDCYAAADPAQFYLRATFDNPPKMAALVRLSALAQSLEERYRLPLVLVAYDLDLTWEEVEEMNRALNRTA